VMTTTVMTMTVMTTTMRLLLRAQAGVEEIITDVMDVESLGKLFLTHEYYCAR